MKFETKKGMLMFFKNHPVILFIVSVDKESVQEWYSNAERNYFEIDEEKLDWYSKWYSDLRIYRNGELK